MTKGTNRMRIQRRGMGAYSWKRLFYTLCFLLFCLVDQRSKTLPGQWLWRDLTGVGMGLLLLGHYRWEDYRFHKIPLLVWTALWMAGAPALFFCVRDGLTQDERWDWLVIAAGVILFGYVLIFTFFQVVVQKKRPRFYGKYAGAWLVMMLLMIFSRSDKTWPLWYLVMFGCFYLTDYSREEREELFQGMLDGIILGFFILQGHCFVLRPYDQARYAGFYSNSNSNSLFYLMVLTAVLVKILHVTKKGSSRWARLYYWTGAGTLLSFEFLTIGRMGWITAVFLAAAFGVFLKKLKESAKLWKTGLILLCSMCLTFLPCFGAVRYLPPLFHHPVWFLGEWSEFRVHSWDPWNSEKYVELDEFLDQSWGRIRNTVETLLDHSPFLMKADAQELQEPVLTPEESGDYVLIRTAIYRHYLERLNLLGHPDSEQGFWLTDTFWVYHAHNLFLQYATDFGVPAAALMLALTVWGAVFLWKRFCRFRSEWDAGRWLFFLIPGVFGLFEYSWGTGSLSILVLFIVWRGVICHEEE